MPSALEDYLRPRTIAEAVAALEARDALILAGGTDVYPAHVGKPVMRPVVDLSRVERLRGITEEGGYYRIGAATTWSDVFRAKLTPAFDALKQAAREVGSIQIQNRGTVGGNLCNASPAADGIPPLLALDAEVELVGPSGTRRMPLSSFLTGYRKTALERGEILSAILVQNSVDGANSAFIKLGARRYLVISIVMAAAVLWRDGKGRVSDARVAVGAASAVTRRLPELERDLEGFSGTPSTAVKPRHVISLSPIDDVRATAGYRSDAAVTIVKQALDRAAGLVTDG